MARSGGAQAPDSGDPASVRRRRGPPGRRAVLRNYSVPCNNVLRPVAVLASVAKPYVTVGERHAGTRSPLR
jgi:hypothetical protein